MNSDIAYIEKYKNELVRKESDETYNKLINLLFKKGLYSEASDYCKKYLDYHKCEDSYLLNLKYFYIVKDEKNFTDLFEQFVYSPIKLSDRGNNIVRFWIE